MPLAILFSSESSFLSFALGTRVIGLYSPFLSAAPDCWGPYGQPENVFVPDGVFCHRCTWDRCERYNCLSAIRPETVLARALELLATLPGAKV